MCLSAGLGHFSLQGYRQLNAGLLGSQVTNKQSGHDPLFLELLDSNKGTTHSDILSFTSVAIMALCRNVLQKDNILCE